MIRHSRIEEIWRSTLLKLSVVVAVGLGILVYHLIRRGQTDIGPANVDLAVAFLFVIGCAVVFYFIARAIKGTIARRFGED